MGTPGVAAWVRILGAVLAGGGGCLCTAVPSAHILDGNATTVARAAVIGTDGGWWVTGGFTGELSAGPGVALATSIFGFGTDVFLGRWKPDGSPGSLVSLGEGLIRGTGLRLALVPDGGVYWVGEFQGDAVFGSVTLPGPGGFVARLDASGGARWARKFEWSANGVFAGGMDTLFVSGQRIRTIVENGIAYAGMGSVVSRLASADGSTVWSLVAGGSGQSYGRHVVVDAEGTVLLMGSFSGTLTLGDRSVTSAGDYDFYVARLSAAGEVLWLRGWGTPADDGALAIATGDDGRFFLTGYLGAPLEIGGSALENVGGADAFVAAFSPSGEPLWARSFGGPGDDYGDGLRRLPGGGLQVAASMDEGTVVGGVPLTGVGWRDVLLLEVDDSGVPGTTRVLGTPGVDEVHVLAGDPVVGGLLVASFGGPVEMEGSPFGDLGAGDLVLVRYPGTKEPSGSPVLADVRWDPVQREFVFSASSPAGRFILETSTDLNEWVSVREVSLDGGPATIRWPVNVKDAASYFRMTTRNE